MSSVPMIESVAASLGELRERFVFVGGAVLELLITDPTVIDFRPTTDVDLVVEATTYGSYASVEQTLADRGFTHVDGPEVPICRWRIDEIIADVMPTEESILGFGNRWYREVMRTAHRYTLPSGMEIRLTAPHRTSSQPSLRRSEPVATATPVSATTWKVLLQSWTAVPESRKR